MKAFSVSLYDEVIPSAAQVISDTDWTRLYLKPQLSSLDFGSYLILQRLCIKITNLKWRILYCLLSMHLNFSFVIHHMYSRFITVSDSSHTDRLQSFHLESTYKHANFQSDCINYYATSCSLSAQVFVSLHGNNVKGAGLQHWTTKNWSLDMPKFARLVIKSLNDIGNLVWGM